MRLNWFQILRYRKNKFVIYGQGQWVGHIMDWRGMNMYHGRLPKSPVFNSVEEAIEWLKFQVKHGVYYEKMELTGHHSGEFQCSMGCDDRIVIDTIFFSQLKRR